MEIFSFDKSNVHFRMANGKICLLSLIVFGHVLFGISSILFIVFFAFGIDNKIVDGFVTATVVSFLLFRRCIVVDLYESVRCGETDLPDYARDNFF